MTKQNVKHILGLSGGKDSAALAVYMREKYPEIPLEYVFIDSGCELPETEEYIQRIQAILNIRITRIGGSSRQDRRDFAWWLKAKNYYLPSPKNRWCTEVLKLIPYSKWLRQQYGDCLIHSYIGLRFDEKRDRSGYLDTSGLLVSRHPFIEDGLVYEDIISLLESSGIGLPSYYAWRSRSGCFFCFYQTKREWLGLYDNHKDLFLQAAAMEKKDPMTGKQFTWCEGMTLHELLTRRKQIVEGSVENDFSEEKRPKLLHSLKSSYKEKSINPAELIRGGQYHDH